MKFISERFIFATWENCKSILKNTKLYSGGRVYRELIKFYKIYFLMHLLYINIIFSEIYAIRISGS